METIKLEVQARDLTAKPNVLRAKKIIPAVYYGQGAESTLLQMDYQTFRKTFRETGYNTLIDLSVDGKAAKKVLVHDVQQNPVSGEFTHVDFITVNMKEEVETEIPVKIVGEAPAVKIHNGILNVVKDELMVKCLPSDLPHELEIDITGLEELNDAIHINEVNVPKGVELVGEPEDVVIIINAPRMEQEEEETPAEGEEGAEASTVEGGADEKDDKKEE
ncbi:50S ribosomal protein L25 [Candidatus Peregrinibacteria bacterium]|nr:50S ribosomal protein L25 [Candidatus Peregrinibacteria bacterium]